MKNLGRRILLIAVAACAAMTAHAQRNDEQDGWPYFSGEELYGWCRSGDVADRRACEIYVCGLSDGMATALMINHKRPYRICLRHGMTCGPVSEVVVKYLEAHPADRARPASELAGEALRDAFPCHGRFWIDE